MFCNIISGALDGVSAYLVGVEVDIDRGLPGFRMVGSLGNEVRESRERVMVALKNAGLDIPPNQITVNLSPANRRKEGTAFDLPIAVGILCAQGMVSGEAAQGVLFLGELGLSGEIKRVRGTLPIVRAAAKGGIRKCVVPKANGSEGAVIPGVQVYGVENIRELLEVLLASGEFPDISLEKTGEITENQWGKLPDFSDVKGQESAKRAAMIAAAGFHNLLLLGHIVTVPKVA